MLEIQMFLWPDASVVVVLIISAKDRHQYFGVSETLRPWTNVMAFQPSNLLADKFLCKTVVEQKKESNHNVLVIRFALFFTYKYRQL